MTQTAQKQVSEWFPHRLTCPTTEALPAADALAMWELIADDFLATLPLED